MSKEQIELQPLNVKWGDDEKRRTTDSTPLKKEPTGEKKIIDTSQGLFRQSKLSKRINKAQICIQEMTNILENKRILQKEESDIMLSKTAELLDYTDKIVDAFELTKVTELELRKFFEFCNSQLNELESKRKKISTIPSLSELSKEDAIIKEEVLITVLEEFQQKIKDTAKESEDSIDLPSLKRSSTW